MDQSKTPETTTEKHKALFSRYGIVPSRGNLLHHQLEVSKQVPPPSSAAKLGLTRFS
jgi:hypothetical protein